MVEENLRPRQRFEIVSVSGLATWHWCSRPFDMCAICGNVVTAPCIECQASQDTDAQCSEVWGICNHAFHEHCIQRWLERRSSCPLDNTTWQKRDN